ncbi:FAD-dependent oxidoreductase [Anaerosinus massiliensis]|uniref:FAD-dependent oxidoreductase n=1 Tax=Massilibacillus massiliensis TaxID=1806837 RepID=UPI000AF0ABBD|nr:FAD-dependent oxidoreductase [Massilibacillus massiliensis]
MDKDLEVRKSGISRRGFLKNSALSVAGVVGSSFLLTACGKGRKAGEEKTDEGNKLVAGQEPSFLKTPTPIKDSDIKETVEADVVVVGAGMAGLCAAISAAQEGAKVTLIEKTQSVNFRSYDYGAINAKVQKEAGITINPLDVTREIMKFGSYKPDQKVVQEFVNNSGKVNDWLLDLALKAGCTIKHIHTEEELVAPVSTLPTFPSLTFVLEPPEEAATKIQKGIYGGKATIATAYTLLTTAEKLGVEIRYKTPAEQLIRVENKGRVQGVIGKAEDGKYIKFNAKKGVILCAGDYGHDEEMLKYYVPTSEAIHKISYPGKYNTGDGQKMGIWIGAAIDEGPHCAMYFDKAFVDDPKVNPDSLVRQPWLGVNLKGERYGNEDLPFSYLSNAVRQQPGHSKWNIWDSKWPEEGPKFRQTACKEMLTVEHHNPKVIEEYIQKGLIKKADTIEQLAELTKLPVETLKKTIARYNELAKKGVDEDFGKPNLFMTTIDKPPFYAANIGTSMLVTLGGLQINDKMQVLDKEKDIIQGLYAAGNNSGSFFGADYPNFVPGNSHGRAYTFGYLSGKNVLNLS